MCAPSCLSFSGFCNLALGDYVGLVLAWGKDAEGIEGERALELLMLKQIEKNITKCSYYRVENYIYCAISGISSCLVKIHVLSLFDDTFCKPLNKH